MVRIFLDAYLAARLMYIAPEGDEACVDSGFAQCVGGKFEVSQCGSTLICAALPLVNKAGTSITCTTEADAEARIQATGATGGLTG